MYPHKLWPVFRFVLVVLASLLAASAIAAAQETVLYSFYDSGGTVLPQAGVISDASGNLYGTTFYSGAYGMGMVYELTPTANGWQETILHSFNTDGVDGFFPTGGVIFGPDGNLYGTTEFGGSGNCSVGFGCGTVYELSPDGNGGWTETILHEFSGNDGWQAHSGLVFDSAGNLYGTTANGGAFHEGTVYELSPAKNGGWSLETLHSFRAKLDGAVPWGGVILDSAGNLYGMTNQGGGRITGCSYGCGTLFELIRPTSGGGWGTKILHNFNRDGDGHYPYGSLLMDPSGNLYGATGSGGGQRDAGIVFELIPSSSGQWTEKLLHNFNNGIWDGSGPSANLIFDSAGNLYSTTLGGGAENEGTVFELTPAANGSWTETILHNFIRQNADGVNPNGGVILDSAGNVYTATDSGGQYAEGAVIEIVR
jgi:uncharacterized repeat protein (TIGR03803 family)